MLAALSFWDYAQQTDRAIPGVGEAYKATGRCFSVAAGRISFSYGLKGERFAGQWTLTLRCVASYKQTGNATCRAIAECGHRLQQQPFSRPSGAAHAARGALSAGTSDVR